MGHVAVIESQTMLTFKEVEAQATASAEAIQLVGTVFYSRSHSIVQQTAFPLAIKLGEADVPLKAAKLEWLRQNLAKYSSHPLVGGEELAAWDLVWTGPNGRVELEITKKGPRFRYDVTTDVLGPTGVPTSRKRFVENSFFVLNPTYFEAGRVTKAVGDVFVTSDPDIVRSLLPSPGMVYHLWGSEVERGRWRTVLGEADLEQVP